ncbi:MAG: hydrogenase expression/formation protein HypE [Clostridiales bacterium]|nr:hydrogenase expression/formation protein HypE [Clostridiales bacterium]
MTLDYGSGGKKTSRLIEELLLPALDNPALRALGDGATVPGGGTLVLSTDSFVVSPRFFPGGDVGKLAVCGTVNDVCMCGGQPLYLTLGLILEEGLPFAELRQIIASLAAAANEAGVCVVTGDTKVVERGRGDGIYLNTAGVGLLRHPGLGPDAIRPGDALILSGPAGDHGAAVMAARAGIAGEALVSDCACVRGAVEALFDSGVSVRMLRDPTRGGVATTVCELSDQSGLSFALEEPAVPVREATRAACEMMGLDPLYCACEGRFLAVVPADEADAALHALHGTAQGAQAAVIGHAAEETLPRVTLATPAGGRRILQKLSGAQLPRIC